VLHRQPTERIGKAVTLRGGADTCLIGTGTILSEVLKAADARGAERARPRQASIP
jgi:transketolase C-terminal domain/subunit